MADGTTIAAGIDLSVNVQNALKGVQSLESSVEKLEKSFSDVSKQVDAVISRIENLTSVASKANQTVNNIDRQTIKIKAPKAPYSVAGAAGSMGSQTGRGKAFKEYEQSLIDAQKALTEETKTRSELNKELANDTKERARHRAQDSATRKTNADANLLAASKKLDQNTSDYLNALKARTDALNESRKYRAYREKHPELFASGGMAWNLRYQMGNATRNVGNYASQLGTGGRIVGDVLGIAGNVIKAPAAGLAAGLDVAARAVMDFSKAAVTAYAEIESTKTQLGVVFSSQTQADSMFGELASYATKSPFGVQQTSELAILLKQSGVYASDLMNTLKMLGDTAGGNMEKMKRIANNYAQIVSIGKASMLDMRQFAYAGIPIFEAVSKELKVSQSELRKLISDGKVTSDIIEKVFKDLTGVNGIFENATDIGAKTLKARLQNLADAKQLAMSEFGERIVNYGVQTGNDSYVNKLVSITENIFQHLHDWEAVENIEKSVKVIERRNNNIAELKAMLELAKKTNDTVTQNALERMIATLQAKGSIDEERLIYAKSYDNKYIDYDTAKKTVDSFGHNMLVYGSYENLYNSAKGEQFRREGGGGYNSEFRIYSDELLQAFIKALEDLLNAEKANNSISDEEKLANIERNLLNAQSLAYDNANKMADSSTSLNSYFDELASIFENSEEQQKKKEEEKIKILKAAQEELKKLVSHADNKGTVDIQSFSRTELADYIEKGAFRAVGKLNVVKSDDKIAMAENRPILMGNYKKLLSEISLELPGIHPEKLDDLNNIKDDKLFYEAFNKRNDEFLSYLKSLVKEGRITDKQRQSFEKSIAQYLNKYELRAEGVDADLTNLKKGKEKELFIDLWKRIVANATGWDASKIGRGNDFFTNEDYGYNKYMSRQILTGGIEGLVKSGMGAGQLLSMMKYDEGKNKQNVRQINWEKTEKEMLSYALSMKDGTKRSAAALSGFSTAIENQVSTLQKLTVDMVGVGEDWTHINNDIKEMYSVAQGLGVRNVLDSAFQTSAPENEKYEMRFNEDSGLLSVYDKTTENFIGSVNELKESVGKNSKELDNFVKEIKVDSIIKELDLSRRQMEVLSDTVKLATTIAQQSLEWQKKANETWGKAVGGSSGMMASVLKIYNKNLVDELSDMGNVNLSKRPQIPWHKMKEKGWGDGEGTATVYTNTYSNRDFGFNEGEEIAINVTPILPNGEILTPDELDNYVRDIIAHYENFSIIHDEKGIYLGGAVGNNAILRAEKQAQAIHENQAVIYGMSPAIESVSDETKAYLNGFLSDFTAQIASLDVDNWNNEAIGKTAKKLGREEKFSETELNAIRDAAKDFQNSGGSIEKLNTLLTALGTPLASLVDSAKKLVESDEKSKNLKAADDILNNTPLSFNDSYDGKHNLKIFEMNPGDMRMTERYRNAKALGNSYYQQGLLLARGYGERSFSDVSRDITAEAIRTNKTNLTSKYKENLSNLDLSFGQKLLAEDAIDTGNVEKLHNILGTLEEDFYKLNESSNATAMAWGDLGATMIALGDNMGQMMQSFTANAATSTMETWGKAMAEGADEGKAMKENFRQLSAGLASSMGQMMTQAGLAMIIGSLGKGPKFWTGLALVAAGAGAAFLGGYLSGNDDDEEKDNGEYQKLLRIKEDLADLLKQAREDAIYYENTLRHKKAITANESFTTKKVNDAIITPSGDIISTHPDDYLIATKTPQTLVNGSGGGAPTINFSVIDKSTGIKVTQQKSSYNADNNSIDFEAVIESKVQEIIAGPRGDEAFSAREYRLNGRRVIS